MRCYYHFDRDAVASCKNCQRGLCVDCATEIGSDGLACKDRCEEKVESLNSLVERSSNAYSIAHKVHARFASIFLTCGLVFGGLAGLFYRWTNSVIIVATFGTLAVFMLLCGASYARSAKNYRDAFKAREKSPADNPYKT